MNSYKKLTNIAGWLVFTIAFIVYFLSAERVGSLWDCGEFITGAYKLQVVHPPGAALFLIIGRMFTFVAEIFSDNPENISFSVNLLSGICSAFAAMFICWSTIILGKLALVGREEEPDSAERIAILGGGIAAGLATAFSTSIWFSAVEGEVYAMSTFFTAMTLWAMMKWYNLPDTPQADRWIIFAVYSAGLSTGVHLLSILTFPALGMFYYFKKNKDPKFLGMAVAAAAGIGIIIGIQALIIIGIPKLWYAFEILMVNSFGGPIHSGLIPTILLIGAGIFFGLRYAHSTKNQTMQHIIVAASLLVVSFSTIGVVLIRANANTPINMNDPSDITRLIPYLNREQYGERPLLKGPSFDAAPYKIDREERYGVVVDKDGNKKYEIVDDKTSAVYRDKDKAFFPRMGHTDDNRRQLYRLWLDLPTDINKKMPAGRPSTADNVGFMLRYQFGWMYWRYFMWNFSGRQNGDQGYFPWDPKSGHWITGFDFIDNQRLYNQSEMPEAMKNHKGKNKYYMLPFLFGLFGLFFHVRRRPNDFLGLLALFIITGLGIIIYSNQPPNEPRERDYVLVGSFFTYCIWIGMGAMAIFQLLRKKIQPGIAAPISVAIVMIAPLLMGFQNFDDHNRKHHTASRDYATNFLNSCDPNSIIFTYGDNDTYPLWYAQEVEGIRTDVRVVNLSLIAVDWYIDQLRRKVNDSPAIKMTISEEAYRGKKRVQLPVDPFGQFKGKEMNIQSVLKFIGEDNLLQTQGGASIESYVPTKTISIPVNKARVISNNTVYESDTASIVSKVTFNLGKNTLLKGDIAILDILGSNAFERPIYFAVTCRPESLMGIRDYLSLEGLALKFVPIKSKGDSRAFGMVGSGRVDSDKVYENVMTKWRWGNFDKMDLFVDRSYGPSVQTQKIAILRAAEGLLDEGKKEKAINLIDKHFEAFPNMNFTYDRETLRYINIFLTAGAFEKAKPHLKIMIKEAAEHLKFYYSLDEEDLSAGFGRDFAYMDDTRKQLKSILGQLKDPELDQAYKEQLSIFDTETIQNPDSNRN